MQPDANGHDAISDLRTAMSPSNGGAAHGSTPLPPSGKRVLVQEKVAVSTADAEKENGQRPEVVSKVELQDWQVLTLGDALEGEDEAFDWVIEGVLLKGAACLTSGQPHAGKSLNWLAAALETVTCKKAWGQFDATKVRRVLFIETEDPKQVVRNRIRQLAKGLRIDPQRCPEGFFWVRPGPFDLVQMKAKLMSLLKSYEPDWCVISTLQGLLGARNWSSQSEMADVNATIVELAHKYCPIVLITHSPQDTNAKRAAGTITQAANYLTVMHFEKKVSEEATVTRVTMDCKLGDKAEFELRLQTEGKEVRRVTYQEQKPSKADLIRQEHKDNPEATVNEIADEVGCTPRYVRSVLKQPEPEPGPGSLTEFMKELWPLAKAKKQKAAPAASTPSAKSKRVRKFARRRRAR